MTNVIPITHSKFEIISIKPRSSIVSPLKTRDTNLKSRIQQHLCMTPPNITYSYIWKTKNNQSMTDNSLKKKIVLKKNKNCRCNNKHHHFQQNQKSHQVSLSGLLTQQKSRKSKQYFHISIDLDKIRNEEKRNLKETFVTDKNDFKNLQPQLMKYQTKNTQMTTNLLDKEEETKEDQNIFNHVYLKQAQKKSARRKNSSKQIKYNIFKIYENKSKSSYRTKSLDTILRNSKPQKVIGKEESEKKQIPNKKQTKLKPSILTQQQTLKVLFKKLTSKNLPYENWINYINLTFQELTMDELHFMGILLQRVQPKYLNAMDYLTFKFKIYQNCQKEFQELLYFQQLNR